MVSSCSMPHGMPWAMATTIYGVSIAQSNVLYVCCTLIIVMRKRPDANKVHESRAIAHCSLLLIVYYGWSLIRSNLWS